MKNRSSTQNSLYHPETFRSRHTFRFLRRCATSHDPETKSLDQKQRRTRFSFSFVRSPQTPTRSTRGQPPKKCQDFHFHSTARPDGRSSAEAIFVSHEPRARLSNELELVLRGTCCNGTWSRDIAGGHMRRARNKEISTTATNSVDDNYILNCINYFL